MPRTAAIVRSCLFLTACAAILSGATAFGQEELRRLDRNRDGNLDLSSEVPESLRGNITRAAERAGLNHNQPLPIDRLAEAMRSSSRDSGGSSGNNNDRPEERRDEERSRDSGSREERSREERSSRDDRGGSREDRGGYSREDRGGYSREDRGGYSREDRGGYSRDDRSREGEQQRDSRPSGSSSTSTAPKLTSTIPGFGVSASGTPLVPGFDVPLRSINSQSSKPVESIFDPRAVERARKTLSENDRNKNGMLDADELDAGKWTSPPIEDSDANKDGKLSLYELCARYAKRYGWNDAPGALKATSTGSGGDSRGGDHREGGGDKVREYAQSLLKQFDENKDGMLQKDEWMKMRSEYHNADQNGDHVLTLDEVYLKLNSMSAATGGGGSGGSSGGGGDGKGYGRGGDGKGGGGYGKGGSSSTSKTGKPGDNKTLRVLTPTERLPKGLPEWFTRNDSDGDGQILMSEYATTWTDTTAAEFAKYDLNGDGFITPRECLDAQEAMKKK